MKNLKYVLLVIVVLPLLSTLYWQDSTVAASSMLAFTDTPPPTDTPPTNTPQPTNSPTNTPNVPPTDTPVGSTNPTPVDTPGSSTSPEDTPIETPSVIPALGNGPRINSILFYGAVLLTLLGVVTIGWLNVWQAYRQQNL